MLVVTAAEVFTLPESVVLVPEPYVAKRRLFRRGSFTP